MSQEVAGKNDYLTLVVDLPAKDTTNKLMHHRENLRMGIATDILPQDTVPTQGVEVDVANEALHYLSHFRRTRNG